MADLQEVIWSVERRHCQWTWTTPNADFKVTPLFNAEYRRNGTSYRLQWHSLIRYNKILVGTYALLKNVIPNDLEWPWVTKWNIQWYEASRGLSSTAELLVTGYITCCLQQVMYPAAVRDAPEPLEDMAVWTDTGVTLTSFSGCTSFRFWF